MDDIAFDIKTHMSKRQKLLQKWKDNTPTEARIAEVKGILDIFFPEEWRWQGGSHIVIECEKLKQFKDTSPLGILSIPVKKGHSVKGVYLKKFSRVIEYIQQLEENL